jgi:RNA polymerase sigma-70 factor (ECF subfamily)
MPPNSPFTALLRRVRAGDQEAAAELVRQFEPEIRRAIRIHLTDSRLRRTLDSMDICQSVLANFFVRAAAGQFDLEDPRQLFRLLVKMANNKLLDHARHQQAERRDQRRVQAGGSVLEGVAGSESTPSQILAGRELLDALRQRMTEEERWIAEQRAAGREWADIAQELGDKPEALRKRFDRAMNRLTRELGIQPSQGADHLEPKEN